MCMHVHIYIYIYVCMYVHNNKHIQQRHTYIDTFIYIYIDHSSNLVCVVVFGETLLAKGVYRP